MLLHIADFMDDFFPNFVIWLRTMHTYYSANSTHLLHIADMGTTHSHAHANSTSEMSQNVGGFHLVELHGKSAGVGFLIFVFLFALTCLGFCCASPLRRLYAAWTAHQKVKDARARKRHSARIAKAERDVELGIPAVPPVAALHQQQLVPTTYALTYEGTMGRTGRSQSTGRIYPDLGSPDVTLHPGNGVATYTAAPGPTYTPSPATATAPPKPTANTMESAGDPNIPAGDYIR